MIRAKLDYSTQFIGLEDGYYCVYCGKKIKPDTEIDHHEVTEYYHCDCEDALKEIEVHNNIERLKKELKDWLNKYPEPKYKIDTKRTLVKK